MKKVLLSLIFVACFFGANAQKEGFIYDGGLTIKTVNDFFKIQGNDIKNTKAFLKENSIAGSPYLNEEFILGYIITKNNFKFIDVPLRYNIYNDEIEFRTQEEVFALDNPLNYPEISIGSQVFIYCTIESGTGEDASNSSYFEVLNPKMELLLLKRFGVRFINPVPNKGYVEAKPAEFKKDPVRYYLKFEKCSAQEVGRLKSTLLLFGDKSKVVEEFIKREKLKISREEDLLKVVFFYNELL